YEGWIDPKQFVKITAVTYAKLNELQYLSGLVVSQPLKIETGEIINLVPGSSLPLFDGRHLYLADEKYTFTGKAVKPDTGLFTQNIESAARFYLHTPYLWGGKSTFGIDCSGLTQMVFKQFGIKIKRDTWQQAEQGKEVNSLAETKPGDLAFFDNSEGRIIHVGILLNNNEIIHASGRVKIDRIDEKGIYSEELLQYTHKLRIIKRYHQ
ncbi:MAG TPA: hydrolase Nlp/P60, partial [Sphingobacteriaceae bacterium]|nr:hydrolase Nlp/P60 [Sphingobacteriaceae bacterium]